MTAAVSTRAFRTETLQHLAGIIERMETLGKDAEDAAARINTALRRTKLPADHRLTQAIGDVIDVVTERSRLAHEAHRLMSRLQRELSSPSLTTASHKTRR
jgi:hypothetical protein